jgi:hypothetical protein
MQSNHLNSHIRTFTRGVFVSKRLPEIAIRLPASFRYLGSTAFVLRQLAEVDRHHFLETNPEGSMRSLVILHFESFLPAINGTFNYRMPHPPDRAGPAFRFSPEVVTLGEHEYIHNTWFFDAHEDIKSNPDAELVRTAQLLAELGYALPGELQMSRYVRVVSPDRKSEMILFYLEPLAPTGLRIEDFVAGGPAESVVDDLSDRLTARSGEVFMVERG